MASPPPTNFLTTPPNFQMEGGGGYFYLLYDVTVIQRIMSFHNNVMTTCYITLSAGTNGIIPDNNANFH